jgi:hypothetical protein
MELRDALKRTRTGSPTGPAPGEAAPAIRSQTDVPASNIPIRVPEHFLGRDDALASVEAALDRYEGRVAITALHGLRGRRFPSATGRRGGSERKPKPLCARTSSHSLSASGG